MIMVSTVHIIDDDSMLLKFLKELLDSVQLDVKTYHSAHDFLSQQKADSPGCILLDIRMPKMSGVELQQEINARGLDLPIIFLTGHGDVQMAVNAMRENAFDFIEKPFNNQHLIDRVQKALELSEMSYKQKNANLSLSQKYNNLSSREKDVFKLIVSGETNKSMAHSLNISIKTVEVHRSRVMTKLNASGLAELIKVERSIPTH